MSTFTIDDFKEVLEEIDVEIPRDFSQNSVIEDGLFMDSQEIVELVGEIEDEYNIDIEAGLIKRTDNVKTVINKINKLIKEDNNEH